MAVTAAQIGNNSYQELNQSDLQNAIDSQFGTEKAIVTDNGDGTFTVSLIDSKRDYNITSNGIEDGINWNEAMANAVAPESQDEERNNGVIGIGTDGNPVDMDLWEYTLLNDGTYGLNDSTTYNCIEVGGTEDKNVRTKGYLGTYTSDGKIVSTLPMYISTDNGKTYIQVTDMYCTFKNDTELIIAPEIPIGVNNMNSTFYNCTSLTSAPEIPVGVTTMQSTFDGCTSMVLPPSSIPSSVINIKRIFKNCYKLNGTIEINANINGSLIEEEVDYYLWFHLNNLEMNESEVYLKGICPILDILIENSNNPNISLLQ